MREDVQALGLPLTDVNYGKVRDLPKYGWETGVVKTSEGEMRSIATFCSLAATFQELGPRGVELGSYTINMVRNDHSTGMFLRNTVKKIKGESFDPTACSKRVKQKLFFFLALAPASFELPAGENLVLSGPNGSGKTTLLSCLDGLIRPSGGTVTAAGFDLYRDEIEVRQCLV